jgi:Uma2 family endonuclease
MPGPGRGSLLGVPTLVRAPYPVEFEALLDRRRQLGQDLFDEVWEGVYHMNPAPAEQHGDLAQQLAEILGPPARQAGLAPMISPFNLGEPDNYRVPDGGLRRDRSNRAYLPTAALVVEVASPGDETWEKLDFYAAHHVDELLIVDPEKRHMHWLGLQPSGEYRPLGRSKLIGLSAGELAAALDWP